MAARSAVSEMLRTRGSRVLILDSLPRFRSLSDSAIGLYTLLTSILVRFSICGITPDTAQSEQAFQTTEARPGKPTGSTHIRGSRRSSPHKSTPGAGALGA